MTSDQTTIVYAVLLVLLLLVLYFGFLRPDRKAKKAKQSLQSSLRAGDRVYTKAGIHGVVLSVDGDLVLLEVGEAGTQLEVARWAILHTEGGDGAATRTIPLNHGDGE